MIYALVGKSCSGKSTVFKRLMELGFETTTSYTTRPKRPSEVDGKEYKFISVEEFHKKIDSIVAPRCYNDWFYGIDMTSIDDSKDQVVIVDPQGYRDLVEALGDHHVVGIYYMVPFPFRLVRGINRKDRLSELIRRFIADESDFQHIEREVDHIIYNLEFHSVLDATLEIIKGGSQK
ncbi:guanylate kinase [Bacillus wiedmannii]|uniref:guanylate kinase n=1 Tax=Bacillus wiedmannii TaxID=1890302 RepID=UPI000BFBE80D|nr:guanylate kinase [Bacillus wiedmannii]PHE70538.1 guanylate kinase/L-type calcium channel region [Bacillus wiedmannii]